MDFDKVTKEAVIHAISDIDKNGIPKNANSSTYDVLYDNKRYPPKLIMEYAYKYSTGTQISRKDFEGGNKTICFNRLRELGFTIVSKKKDFNFYDTLIKFIEQSKTNNLKIQGYRNKIENLSIAISFGKGNIARIPWISFLYDGQTTSHGIYPVYLYYKEYDILILAYGLSETIPPEINWSFDTPPETISDFFQKKGIKPKRYGSSYIFKSYNINEFISTNY